MENDPKERLVSEPVTPAPASGSAAMAARGEPGLPGEFTWCGQAYRVGEVVEVWKTTGPCRNGSREVYVRRHWYRVRTEPAAEMVLYCDRQSRQGGRPTSRWWLYTVRELES